MEAQPEGSSGLVQNAARGALPLFICAMCMDQKYILFRTLGGEPHPAMCIYTATSAAIDQIFHLFLDELVYPSVAAGNPN